jgi:aspartate/methionine/tyrosine aminotransferase
VVSIKELIYGPYEGSAKLIEQTRQVIKETTGNSYDHVLIVNGASSGLNLLLRKFKKDGGAIVRTSQYGYPSYEDMIKRAGMN